MTNAEKYKDKIHKMINSRGCFTVSGGVLVEHSGKTMSMCTHCDFNEEEDCADARISWLMEEAKEVPTLTERQWHFLKSLPENARIHNGKFTGMVISVEKERYFVGESAIDKGVITIPNIKKDESYSVKEMLTWPVKKDEE